MQKLKDAAMLLKAKITKDQTEELLIQATSEQNWQTPTPILHDICNAAYNYEEWQKIQAFIWEKLKMKKWRKVLKTLNLVEFLLKNGPQRIISTFKHETYTFKSLDHNNYSDDKGDKGEAIRERAKIIVDLLNNQQLLQQERTKAKTIKQRMGGSSGSSSNYQGAGSKGFSSGSNKYGGYDSKGKGASSYGGSTIDSYSGSNNGSSNLNKYKKDLGGQSAYKKTTEEKKQQIKNKKVQVQQIKQVEEPNKPAPKPFDQQGRKLQKPGEVKIDLNKQVSKQVKNNQKQQPQQQQQQSNSSGFNFFDEGQPSQVPVQTTANLNNTQNSNINLNNIQSQSNVQSNSLPFGQFTLPQPQSQQQKVQQQPTINLTNQGLNLFSSNPQQNTQQGNNLGFIFNSQPQNFQAPVQPQFQQQTNQNQGLLGLGNITMNSNPNANIQYSLGTKASNDQFGGFDTGNKQINWMSADESNLTNLYDLSKQVSQKNISNQKQGNTILATNEDFDFMATPSTNFNLGMNFNSNQKQNTNNFGFNSQPQQQNNQFGGLTFF